ncbi:DUF86 domain-containing protein [Bacillus sp. S3]|uniref:DUF86 domain-containing protein n=1 Tax=Bacillus sp. S3 TaxID=486398 RepID=UPI0011894259|nr:DUF86 domain-containing protein [Bacillus sp. S3]QCJ43961.1 DUF86 domain-containing protein [Bacillus sp. S3]
MYFVDRERIEAFLQYLETKINLFHEQKDWSTPTEKTALERLCQMMLEAVLDVGNDMIDGFIMRDPGSYEDIIDILMDEKVITKETGEAFKSLIPYRKMLVQDYMDVDHRELQEQFAKYLPEFGRFSENVREYLTNELGPVSAFKN